MDLVRSALGVLLTIVAFVGCDGRTWTGPLAAAADSVMPVRSGCEVVATFDYELTEIERPVSSCVTSRGDTTFTVIADDARRVLTLSRTIRVDPARQAIVHDSIEFRVASQSQYEAPRICAETGDSAATEVRRWSTLDRQIVLENVRSDEVVLQLRGDHPKCEASTADDAAYRPSGIPTSTGK